MIWWFYQICLFSVWNFVLILVPVSRCVRGVQEPLRELSFLTLAGVGDRTGKPSGVRWIPRAEVPLGFVSYSTSSNCLMKHPSGFLASSDSLCHAGQAAALFSPVFARILGHLRLLFQAPQASRLQPEAREELGTCPD